MPTVDEMVFLSKKCLNDTDTDSKPVKSTGVVTIREIPETLGELLNFNSLASPPALLLDTTDQLSAELLVVVHPSGSDIESKVSLKSTDLFCAKIVTDNNNANVSSNVFFMIFFFCWCLSLSKADCHFDRLSDRLAHCLIIRFTIFPFSVFILTK